MSGEAGAIWSAEQVIWNAAATALSWEWSHAHGGYIRNDHIKPDTTGNNWGDFPSEVDAQEACSIDGIETLDQARDAIAKSTAS